MGAIADMLLEYARPLIDATDGSTEELNKALALSSLCYNLALLPEEDREGSLDKLKQTLELNDIEYDELYRGTILPMIQRHSAMFPPMHRRSFNGHLSTAARRRVEPETAMPEKEPLRIERYAPCPCNSGRKYKFCCGRSPR